MADNITAPDGGTVAPLAGPFADPHLNLDVCEFLNHAPEIIELDPRGDRTCLVGVNRCNITDRGHEHEPAMRFCVSSRTLGRFSPVMAVMFGKSGGATQETVAFPEDNPKAMTTLLNISHGNLDPVYDIGTSTNGGFLDDVYQIAALANKYKVTPLLRIWAPTWISMLERLAESLVLSTYPLISTKRESWEKVLYAANEFGHVEIYKKMFECLYCSTQGGVELFSSTLDPRSVKDQIIISRWQSIENITTVLRGVVDTLMNCGLDDTTAGLYTCSATRPGTRGDCKIHTLGVIMRHLGRKSLWALPQTDEVAQSLDLFYNQVTKNMWSERGLHKNCSIRATLDEALKDARKIPPRDFLSQPAIEDMLARAASLGFSNKTSRP